MPAYKQLCNQCKTNRVLIVNRRKRYVVCKECQMKTLSRTIEDPEFKAMFDIPAEWYEENDFLRDIKYNYLRWGSLTERQIEAFKNTVKELKEEAKKKK